MYDEDEEIVSAIDEESVDKRFIKRDCRLLLFTCLGGLEVPVDFYYEAEAPPMDKWSHVIEGCLGVPSGKLSFGAGDPKNNMAIRMKPGVYKVRIYQGIYKEDENHEDVQEEYWHIYLWSTEQKETKEMKIIKQFS